MKGTGSIPHLDDLAFVNRNKAYGAYFLRRRYYRYLAISVITGLLIYFFLALVPFIYMWIDPEPILDDDYLVIVDYTLLPPPDESIPDLSLPAPPTEAPVVPVVKDTVEPEAEKQVTQPDEQPEKKSNDTSGTGKGDSGASGGSGEGSALTTQIDVYPQFPGGDQARHFYLRKNIRYPEEAIRRMIQGTVIVVFVVETDGSVTNVSISKSIGGGCDEEAVRVVNGMPKWEPGKRSGRPVRVMLRMPVVFRIPGRPA